MYKSRDVAFLELLSHFVTAPLPSGAPEITLCCYNVSLRFYIVEYQRYKYAAPLFAQRWQRGAVRS